MKYLYSCILLIAVSCSETISNKTPEEILNDGINTFKTGNYEEAIITFNELILNESVDIKKSAYTGLAFAQMRIDKHEDSYASFKLGQSIESDSAKNDILSGLCFLEFSLKLNFQQAIILGNTLIENDNQFSMIFDSEINLKDIRLTIAQSYFALNNYSDCLKEVQLLGKLLDAKISDITIEERLLNSLRILIEEIK